MTEAEPTAAAHENKSVSLNAAMMRADDAARALCLTGDDRTRFLALIAPGFPEWLNDINPRGQQKFAATIERVERSITPLELDLDDLAVVLETLAGELYASAPKGSPTDAPPGSEAKVRVMIERCSRGEPLFVDGDACLSDRFAFLARAISNHHVRGPLVDLMPPAQDAKGGCGMTSDEEGKQPQPQRAGLGPRGRPRGRPRAK